MKRAKSRLSIKASKMTVVEVKALFAKVKVGTATREEHVLHLMTTGSSEEAAKFQVAISRGESKGDCIELNEP